MSTTKLVTAEQQDQVLLDSIQQQRQLVVTYNSDAGWRTFKGCFVMGSPSSGEMVLRLGLTEPNVSTLLPGEGETVGGAFRLGHKKCMFRCQVRSLGQQAGAAVLTVTWPDGLQQLQRRAYERAEPPAGTIVAVRFWKEVAPSDAGIGARDVRHGQMENISCGGMRIKVADPHDVELAATYRCVFAPSQGKPSIVLDAILRHREAVDQGRASLGFQFVGLETTPEKVRTLDRLAKLVSHFQQARSRKARKHVRA